ncbi:MAG: hypothetical protein Tsb0015_06120 [Simkaniaceae bacterium]
MEEKNKMRTLLRDVKFRLQKLKDNPPSDQIQPILRQIECDRQILQELAQAIGGQILNDFQTFTTDLQHFIKSPDDMAAFPQVQDDINILVNDLELS